MATKVQHRLTRFRPARSKAVVRAPHRDPVLPPEDEALVFAMRLGRSPQVMRSLRQRPLPQGIGSLIRLAAQCPVTSASAAARTGLETGELHAIAALYLRIVLFSGAPDAYRTLGVDRDAGATEIRDHKIWLLKWLHPDRNTDLDALSLTSRVNEAWRELSSPRSLDGNSASKSEASDLGSRRKSFRHVWIRRPIFSE